MTEYFEVLARDGAARIGEVRLAESASTPALAGGLIADAGSLWPADRDLPEAGGDAPTGREHRLTVLPHRAFPAGTDERVQESFAVEYPDVEYPSAAVVTPETAADVGADCYVLSGAPGVVGHGAAFVEAIVGIREAVPDDAALYVPGVATPRNVATLLYAGVDLVDADRAVVRGTQGRYLTTEGAYDLADLEELPCACPACAGEVGEFDREDCVAHNENALGAALRTARRRVRDGRLRDYLEGQARHEGWLTATLRDLDEEWAYVEERAPISRRAEMTAASEDTLHRAEIRRFADRVTGRYRPRFDAPLVLVPCSARKPYSESKSHGRFHDAVGWRGHVVSMTSPIGVVPQELESTYPAQHYDSVVTGRWSAGEIEFVAEVLARYLDRADYDRIVAHVPAEGYREIVERATVDREVPVEFTVADHPTDADSLAALAGALEGEERYPKREREHNTVRAIADYQFGEGAGEALFPELRTEARYPKLRATDSNGTQLAAMVPTVGLLALSLAGAHRWVESPVPTRRVAIDDFVPHGSVLAPGIVDASESIRVGDEVVIEGPSAFAVGRAEMPGPAMESSTRGVAVDVRHVEER
jgi:archaeosine synthase